MNNLKKEIQTNKEVMIIFFVILNLSHCLHCFFIFYFFDFCACNIIYYLNLIWNLHLYLWLLTKNINLLQMLLILWTSSTLHPLIWCKKNMAKSVQTTSYSILHWEKVMISAERIGRRSNMGEFWKRLNGEERQLLQKECQRMEYF